MSYIKLDRKISEWEWFNDANMLRFWIYILTNVNYEDKRWMGEQIPKGSMITAIEHLATATNMTIQQTRTCIAKLEKTGEITKKSTNKYTQINVIKWAEYQCCGEEFNKPITNEQQTNNKRITTTKEIKEIKNKKNIYIPAEIEEEFVAFKEMRTKAKKPLTEKAAKMILSKLDKYAGNDIDLKKKILDRSTLKCWIDVYPYQEDNQNFKSSRLREEAIPVYDTSNNVNFEYDISDYDRIMKEREENGNATK